MRKLLLFLFCCAAGFAQTIPASPGVFSLSATGGGGGGSGTVTSVSFTGGLITVTNPTTTAALTVAGTSGGVPYFSSTSTWASSALLAANALMIGGGAGAAPATTATGTGVLTALGINVGSAGALVTFNGALGTPSGGTLTNATGLPIAGLIAASQAQGDIIYFNGTNWVRLGAGTNGNFLQTQGAGANPQWAAGGAGTISSGTTNRLSKYTASTTLGNSLVSDDGTTLSYTGTGGISVASGSTAGGASYKEGTANTAATDFVGFQAPTNVTTPFFITLPAAPTTGFALLTGTSDPSVMTLVAPTGTGSVMLNTSPDIATSLTTASTSFTLLAGATTLLTWGGTGASASNFAPSTLDATTSTTGAIRTSGGISAAKALNVGTTITGGGALSIGTSNAATVGTIELGAASDTTVSRNAAGVIQVEGNVVSMVGARITAIVSNATPTFDVRTCDVVNITALATAITSMTSSMTITGVVDFQQLEFRILDNGTARAITWGVNFASGTGTLPTTTTLGKTLYVYTEYDSVQAKFMCQSVGSYP